MRTLIACAVVALLVGGGTATAAQLITGKDVKNGSLTGADLEDGSVGFKELTRSARNRAEKPGPQGLKGDTGAKGDTGPAGPAGQQGPKGDTGSKGEAGANGETGPAGPQGENGAAGAQGVPGAQGPAGPAGATGDTGPAGPVGPVGPAGPAGIIAPASAALTAPKVITTIGGPINDGYTDLVTNVALAAGTYLVTIDAAFDSAVDAADPSVEVYPQVSLWIDRDGDNDFTWQDEGDISPNAVMPVAKNRHVSSSGITQITLTEPTEIGLVAHGYTSTQGSERSGEINVVRAVLGTIKVAG